MREKSSAKVGRSAGVGSANGGSSSDSGAPKSPTAGLTGGLRTLEGRGILALDVGGTKLAAAVVDGAGDIVSSAACPTPGADGSDAMWGAIERLFVEVRGAAGLEVAAIGCGCGGPMRGGDDVSPLNIAAWRHEPVASRLTGLVGVPAWVDNDAKALALAEGWKGAAVGVDDYLAMVVSTGVGGGIVSGGRLLDGAAGNAGHIGHVIVEPGGRRCACGARGCLEAEASGTAVRAITGADPAVAPSAVRRRVGMLVGRAVAAVANLLDLRLACVAGSVALGYGEEFFAAAQDEVDAVACLSFSAGTRVVPAGCGSEGPLLGAAAVALRALGELEAEGRSQVV